MLASLHLRNPGNIVILVNLFCYLQHHLSDFYLAMGLHSFFYFLIFFSCTLPVSPLTPFSIVFRSQPFRSAAFCCPRSSCTPLDQSGSLSLSIKRRFLIFRPFLRSSTIVFFFTSYMEGLGSSLKTHQLAILCLGLPCSNGSSDYHSK